MYGVFGDGTNTIKYDEDVEPVFVKNLTLRMPTMIPIFNVVSNLTKVVSGKSEAGASVTVTIGTKKYTTKADTKGNFKVTIPIQKANTKLTVTATAGNSSTAKTVMIIDKAPPSAPKVKTVVKSSTKEVAGSAEAYSTITVKVGTKVIGTGKADKKGKFKIKIKIKAQKKKSIISVTAMDKAKNRSKATKVKVK
jgi:hypothetical protein